MASAVIFCDTLTHESDRTMKSIRDLRWQDDRAGHIARHQVVPTEVEEAVLGDQRALLERAGAARRDPS